MSEHTPGPWEVREGYGLLMAEVGPKDRAVATVWTKRMGQIEDKTVPVEWPEGQANGHLIAAAPDLLEACKIALYGGGTIAEATEKCRAAIAKAEGRA